MMKKSIRLIVVLGALSLPVCAQDFSATRPRPRHEAAVPQPATGAGTFQRAARSGHPLQALNPRAAASYGDARDSLVYDESPRAATDSSRPRPIGVTLFSFEF